MSKQDEIKFRIGKAEYFRVEPQQFFLNGHQLYTAIGSLNSRTIGSTLISYVSNKAHK